MHLRTLFLPIFSAIAMVPSVQAQITNATPIAATAQTAVPRLIKYSGILVDGQGYPLTVPVDVTFSLYEEQTPSSRAALWQETQRVSPNEKGVYMVYLGSASAQGLPTEVFASVSAQWLGVKVDGEIERPRVMLTSVPYALKAGDAQTLGGLPASAFALAGSIAPSVSGSAETQAATTSNTSSTVTTTGGISGYVPKFTGISTLADSQIFANSSGVGINTASPAAKLDVNGDMIVRGPTIVARTGNANTNQGYPSYGFGFYSNVYNSSTKAADNPHFILQSEPVGNNTATTGATFNFLYSNHGSTAESGLYLNADGTIHFAPGQSFPGSVTSVALSPPSSDFNITSGPVTGSGTLSFAWTVAPTSYIVANSIVKRDQSGNTSINNLNANAVNSYGTMFVAQGFTEDGPATFAKTVGIGTTTPQAELNLNAGGTANADTLLIGNNSTKGLQLRDTGTGVDIESITAPLFFNYVTQTPIYMNTAGGAVLIHDGTNTGSSDGTLLPALTVGGNPRSDIFSGEPYSAHFKGTVLADDGIATPDIVVRTDHPLDPGNKYLVHTAIESSESLNQYSGNVTTDELGLAAVHLPDWFEAENTDFRYQLTVISGQFAQAIISKKVANNQFVIGTNAPHVEVSWLVTAKRNDAYIKAHPLVVEQDKPAGERGTYTHPELYGQPEEKRTGGSVAQQ